MELQKWRFQETPNASMQFELSTGFLIAECVLHARRIFTLCRHFMGNIAWNRNMLGTLYEMEWFTTNHNRSLTFKYSFKCNTKAAALADEWPGSWLVLSRVPVASAPLAPPPAAAARHSAWSWTHTPHLSRRWLLGPVTCQHTRSTREKYLNRQRKIFQWHWNGGRQQLTSNDGFKTLAMECCSYSRGDMYESHCEQTF